MRKRFSLTESITKEIRESKEAQPQEISKPALRRNYQGMGGWLLFFCLSLIVLSPALSMYSLYLRGFSLLPGLKGLISEIAQDIVTLFGIVIGIMLFAKKRAALVLVHIFLYTSMGLTLIVSIYGIAVGSSLSFALVSAILNIVYWLLWLLYFVNSRRVAATFSPISVSPDLPEPPTNESQS